MSEFNLTLFSLWFSLSEAEERREAESLHVLVHRPVQLFPEFGLRDGTRWQLPTRSCFAVGCDRCLNGRSGYGFQWGLDRGRVYMEEQAILLRHDNNGANVEIPSAEQSIIVHEQSQPPRVPSPSRLGLCSYKDNEAEARVPLLARAEEDSLAPFGFGEEAHGHMKRKLRRTIRRFFMDGQTYYRGRHIVTGTQLAAFFGQPLSRESGIRPGKHNELSSNSDVSDTVDIGKRLRETSTSFEMERLICASHLLLQPRIR